MKKLLLLFGFIACISGHPAEEQHAKDLFTKMLHACDNLKGAKYRMYKTERQIDGKNLNSEVQVKLMLNPFRVYVYSVKPNHGAEALYIPSVRGDKVMVNPNKFPYVTLNLSPDNFILREGEHHTIREIGFQYITQVFKNNIAKRSSDFYSHLSYDGEIEWNKRRYHSLTINNPLFSHVKYKVQKGEDLIKISRKLDINEFMILCMNKDIDDYYDVKAGQEIIVPNSYGKKIVLYLDKTNYLPLMQSISDDKGLFEKYEYSNFILNPSFDKDEFSPNFKDYNF